MATYLELYALRTDSDLQDRVAVAVVKKAQALLVGATPTAAEVAWAAASIASSKAEVPAMLNYVLAANSAASTAAILAATDATLQSSVDTAADAIIAGGV